MTNSHLLYVRCFALLFCFAVFLSGCSQSKQETSAASLGIKPIAFPQRGDDITIARYEVACDIQSLDRQTTPSSAMVSYDSEGLSAEKLMRHLDIPADSAKTISKEQITYANDRFHLDVFQNGNFGLFSNTDEESVREMTLSDEECLEIAEKFLSENDLLCEDLAADRELGQDKAVDSNGTILIGKVVYYHPKTALGNVQLGNSRVAVHIAADGHVSQLIYSHLHYKKEAQLPLRDAEEACRMITNISDPSSVYLEVSENTGKQLNVTKVQVVYYENVTADVPSRQPVYLFEGGEGDEKFAIALPALKMD
jgi:hypothetical protein